MRKLGGTAPFVGEEEVRSMKKAEAGVTNSVIEQILELSAEAQCERRRTAKDSAAFHHLGGAIMAYGKALGLLVEARKEEELFEIILELGLSECVSERVH